MISRLPLAIYEGMREADILGPWHYKGKNVIFLLENIF